MSWDLILRRRQGSPQLTLAEVDELFAGIPHIERHPSAPDAVTYHYENPDTVVYLTFDYGREGDDESGGCPGEPVLAFNINLARPTFFALEAMPVVTEVARHLELDTADPQEEESSQQPSTDDLINRWIRGNEWAIRSALSSGQVRIGEGEFVRAYASRERLDYWWHWTRNRATIAQALAGDDVFVPTRIFLMAPKMDTDAVMASAWPIFIPTVFPEVDHILLGLAARGFLGLTSKSVKGLVPFAQVRAILGSDLEQVEQPVRHYLYRRHPPRPEVTTSTGALELLPLKQYQALSPDSIVDVKV